MNSADHIALAQQLTAPPNLPLARVLAAPDGAKMAAVQRQFDLIWQDWRSLSRPLPKVSVILPTRNRAATLGPAIDTVLGQSYPQVELIVIDDGSHDGTPALLNAYQGRLHMLRLGGLNLGGLGVGAARNAGLDAATGQIVAYLDSDNLWHKDHLRNLVIAMALTGADCAYDMLVLHQKEAPLRYRGEGFDWDECLRGNYIDLNVFAHLRLPSAVGGAVDSASGPRFDPALPRMVDWDFILRRTRGQGVAFVPLLGCDYNNDPSDAQRISTAQPRLFMNVLREKIRHSLPVAKILANRRYQIALVPLLGDLGRALQQMGHKADVLAQPDLAAPPPEVCIFTSADAKVNPQSVNILVLTQPLHAPSYARLDRFDAILTPDAAQAAHLTAVLRRTAYQIGQLETAGAVLLAALRTALSQPRRARSYVPSAALIGGARAKIGLLAQRGRGWPNASAYLRSICPLTTPQAAQRFDLIELASTDDPRRSDCKAVIVQRFALPSAQHAEDFAANLAGFGCKLVVESDDHAGAIGPDDLRTDALLRAMALADRVFVASPVLQSLHANCGAIALPSGLDPRIWQGGLAPPALPTRGAPLRMVYIGTPTHDADFAPVQAALNRLWLRYPNRFCLTIIGALRAVPSTPWITPAPALSRQTAYPDFCQRALGAGPFHLGIAPLQRSPLNDAKSDIKCLDTAALGAVTLASDVPPYKDIIADGIALNAGQTADDWYHAFCTILEDLPALNARARAAHQWLWDTRTAQAAGGITDHLATLLDQGDGG